MTRDVVCMFNRACRWSYLKSELGSLNEGLTLSQVFEKDDEDLSMMF